MPHTGFRHHEGRATPVAANHSPVARAYPSRALSDHFRSLRCDCSIKERVRQCIRCARFEAFVLNNFFTGRTGEYFVDKVTHRLFTVHRRKRGGAVLGFEFWVLG